jgi:hypothetical protein
LSASRQGGFKKTAGEKNYQKHVENFLQKKTIDFFVNKTKFGRFPLDCLAFLGFSCQGE